MPTPISSELAASATIVNPTIKEEIPKITAMVQAPWINSSAPTPKQTKPAQSTRNPMKQAK